MKPQTRNSLHAFLAGLIITLLALVAKDLLAARAAQPPAATQPSGIWTGLVNDLPSGRAVECVFARDPTGALAITCDWNTAN
ncbi:MAG: hypothetical protein WDA15_06285 [Trueperaceae bacterium]